MRPFFVVSVLVSKTVRMQGRTDIVKIVSGKLIDKMLLKMQVVMCLFSCWTA